MSRSAIFLDRDGTIIVEKHYLSDPSGVLLNEGAGEGLAAMSKTGAPLIVVSNQSGIGRGYFTLEDAERVNARTAELLEPYGVEIAAWRLCPHVPGDNCGCRKPRTGMIEAAALELDIDPRRSIVIGDKDVDLILASNIGAMGILVRTGQGQGHVGAAMAMGATICDDLRQAGDIVTRRWRQT